MTDADAIKRQYETIELGRLDSTTSSVLRNVIAQWSAWEERAMELEAKLCMVEDIIRDIASIEDPSRNDQENGYCFDRNVLTSRFDPPATFVQNEDHDSDCAWLRARAWVSEHPETGPCEILWPGEMPSWAEEVGVVGNMDGTFEIANDKGETERTAKAVLWRNLRVEVVHGPGWGGQ